MKGMRVLSQKNKAGKLLVGKLAFVYALLSGAAYDINKLEKAV